MRVRVADDRSLCLPGGKLAGASEGVTEAKETLVAPETEKKKKNPQRQTRCEIGE